MQNTYIPGACNIGPAEIKRRVVGGWIGLILTIIIGGILLLTHLSPLWRLVVFIPASVGALGFLQAGFHFCVAYGTKGLFNVEHEAGKTESVSQQEFRKKDQQKAVSIIIYGVLIGIIIAGGFFFL